MSFRKLGGGYTVTSTPLGGEGGGTVPAPPGEGSFVKPGFRPPPSPPPGIPSRPAFVTTPNEQARISPVTPELVTSRYAGAARANPNFEVGLTQAGAWPAGGDDQASDGLGWVAIKVDRPTILIPTTSPNARVLSWPIAPPAADSHAFSALGPGVVFLWSPGTWYVKVDENNVRVNFVQVPMDDPAAASLFASQPGAQNVGATTADGGTSRVVYTAKGVSASLLAANPRRRAAVITVARTTAPAAGDALDFGVILSKDGAGPASTNDCHLFLTEESVLELSGDMNWRYDVRGIILSSSVATAVDVYIAEFE